METIKLENLKGFCESYIEEGEKFVEYHTLAEYEIIIDGKILSCIYQDNRDIDKVELFLADDCESLPMAWNDLVNVNINQITKNELPKHSIMKMIMKNDLT
jgi:hypothetical protein